MANKKFWLGMLAVALVFGMTVVGCSDDSTGGGGADSALNGTWVNSEGYTMKFNNGNWETSWAKGTYTTNSGNITVKLTHLSDGSKWYSKNEWKTKYPDEDFGDLFVEETTTYSVTGNTLIYSKDNEVFTRK